MQSRLFSKTVWARAARTFEGRLTAFLIAVGCLLLGAYHRYAGFANPHQVWFRENEKVHLGHWAPSAIEHLFGAFGFISIFTLIMSSFVAPATRNRVLIGIAFASVYVLGSTIGWSGHHYLTSHDPATLTEMLADVIGLIGSVLWLAWPVPEGETQFA